MSVECGTGADVRVYYRASSSVSRQFYTTEMFCCSGYTLINGQCEPSCSPACEAGYTCVAPNMCRRGVQLMLNGVNYPNNSIIQYNSIYNSSDYCHSLLCTTDRVPCCTISQGGSWYLQVESNGSHLELSTVSRSMTAEGYYQSVENDGTLRLVKESSTAPPINESVYCCQLSDATLSEHTLCVSFVESAPGVWLLLNGQLYANNSAVELRDVFESSDDSHSLMCVTSKRPCCATAPSSQGEWFYPNQSTISNSTTGNSFYRTRGDDGTVRLHRRGVASLTAAMGQYCCEIPNENDTTQLLCVHFVDNSPIQVRSSLTGQVYRNNSIVRPSDVYYNEIQTLICETDKRPCCSQQDAWYYGNGSAVPGFGAGHAFHAEGKTDGTVLLYVRNASMMFINSTQFCCELPNINDLIQKVCVNLEDETTPTDSSVVTIAHIIQFHVTGVGKCYDWVHRDTLQKELDLLSAIADGVEESCQCGFSTTYFATGAFQCFQDSAERAVTYRTQLNAPNGTVEQISLWLSTNPSVALTGVLLQLDGTCNLVIESTSDRECESPMEDLPEMNSTSQNNQLYIIIGGGSGTAVIVLMCLCLLVATIATLRRKCRSKSHTCQPHSTNETPKEDVNGEEEIYATVSNANDAVSEYYEDLRQEERLEDVNYDALDELDQNSIYAMPDEN